MKKLYPYGHGPNPCTCSVHIPNMERIVIAGFTFADFGSVSIDQYYSIVMFVVGCDVLMFPYQKIPMPSHAQPTSRGSDLLRDLLSTTVVGVGKGLLPMGPHGFNRCLFPLPLLIRGEPDVTDVSW